MNTIERARGRWKEILPRLGIEPGFLVNKHGPCPLCGGKDRFRFDDIDGSGSYFCRCGPGVGIILVRKRHDWDHRTACDAVDEIIGDGPTAPPPPASPNRSPDARHAKVERVIAEATADEIVKNYLASRGLSVVPDILRGHRALAYYEDGHFVGQFPAMVAPILGPDGTLQSALRTYLVGKGKRKRRTMPTVNTISGGAVRLFAVVDEMGVAEGIETAIACTELFEIPTWSAISAGGMEKFVPPATIKRIHVFGDNDRNYRGQKAAFVLAHRLARDIEVDVAIPPDPGIDWLDVLNEGGGP